MRILPKKHVLLGFFLSILLAWGAPVMGGNSPSFHTKTTINKLQLTAKSSARYKTGEIIVKYKDGTTAAAIEKLDNRLGAGTLAKDSKRNLHRMQMPSNGSMADLLAAYRADANVEYAEPNYLVQASMTPNDSYYSYQWNLYNPTYGGINMENAWDLATGDSSVIIAVIDTGVAYETYGNYKQASDLAKTNFVQGYDFVNNDSHPNDDNGHGTHVTGTLAQSTNNALGVAGVAFGASIMPIKVLDAEGSGDHATVAEGIIYAADHGAKVINLSLGSSNGSNTLKEAIAYAYNKGVTIVAASGNDGEDTVNYPAAYDDYVIAVGATRYDETRADYSNGGTSLDLVAPGGDLTVDQNGDGYVDGILQQTFDGNPSNMGYWFYSGTSMATPHVAGVAALILSYHAYDPAQVREALEQTAEDKGPSGWDSSYGWGLVDAAAAIAYTAAEVHEVGISSVSTATSAVVGETVPITVTVKNSGSYAETVAVAVTDLDSQTVTIAAQDSATLTFNWDTSGSTAGTHNFTVQLSGVTDDNNTANNEKTFSVTLVEAVHDVLISSFTVPSEASQGTNVSLSAVLENAGTYSETLTFTLTDVTGGTTLSSKTLTLAAGGTSTVSATWNTATATVGDHTLKAQLAVVDGETDTADNVVQKTITVTEADATVAIDLLSLQAQSNRGQYAVRAYIQSNASTSETVTLSCTLTDQNGSSISDPGLADKKVMVPAHTRGYVSWMGRSRLARGTYTVTVSIPEADQTKSATLQMR